MMREKYGAFETIFKYFIIHDEEEFEKFTRINIQQFMTLFDLIEEKITKESNREPLLLLIIWYL